LNFPVVYVSGKDCQGKNQAKLGYFPLTPNLVVHTLKGGLLRIKKALWTSHKAFLTLFPLNSKSSIKTCPPPARRSFWRACPPSVWRVRLTESSIANQLMAYSWHVISQMQDTSDEPRVPSGELVPLEFRRSLYQIIHSFPDVFISELGVLPLGNLGLIFFKLLL